MTNSKKELTSTATTNQDNQSSVPMQHSRPRTAHLQVQVPDAPTPTGGQLSTTPIQLTSALLPPYQLPSGSHQPYASHHQNQYHHQHLYPYYDGDWGHVQSDGSNLQPFHTCGGFGGHGAGARSTTPSGYIGCIVPPFDTNHVNIGGFNGPINGHKHHQHHPTGTNQRSNNSNKPSSIQNNQYLHHTPWNNSTVRFSPSTSIYHYPSSGSGVSLMVGSSGGINESSNASFMTTSRGVTAMKSLPKVAKTTQPKSTAQSKSKPTNSNGSLQSYISLRILDAAAILDLPPNGVKFTNSHWSSALRLFYRWKTTMDEMEVSIKNSVVTTSSSSMTKESEGDDGPSKALDVSHSSTSLATDDTEDEGHGNNPGENCDPSTVVSTKKSVKAFVDKVLQRESKRRQFSIHWNDCGLKEFFEKQLKEDRKHIIDSQAAARASAYDGAVFFSSAFFVPFDHPEVSMMLDDYFSGRKRSRDYVEAEQLAMVQRQHEIDTLWESITGGLPRKRLKELQNAIEAPYNSKIVVNKKGKKTTHEVILDGFGGAKYKPITDTSFSSSSSTSTVGRGKAKTKKVDASVKSAAVTLAFVVGDRYPGAAMGLRSSSSLSSTKSMKDNDSNKKEKLIGTTKATWPSSSSRPNSESIVIGTASKSCQPFKDHRTKHQENSELDDTMKNENHVGLDEEANGGGDPVDDELKLLPKISDDKEN